MKKVKVTSKKMFGVVKWARNATAGTLTQPTISSLAQRGRAELATTANSKAEVMYEAHFSSISEVLTGDIENYVYSELMLDDDPISIREIKRAAHKTAPDKTSKQNDYTNRIIRKLIDMEAEQIRSLFERC